MGGFTFAPDTRMLWNGNMIAVINMRTGEWARIPRQVLEALIAMAASAAYETSGPGVLLEEPGSYRSEACGAVVSRLDEPGALARELLDMGILVPGGRGHIRPCGLEVEEEKRLRKVYFNVTEGCNLGCPTCYFSARHGQHISDLSTDAAIDLLERVAWHADPAIFVISGGEPFMREDIDILVKRSAKLFKRVILLTNGCLIDMEHARKIADSGVACIQVSLEGSSSEIHDAVRGRGSFDAALRGIRNLLAAGMRNIEIVPTLTRRNVRDLPALGHLAGELGVGFHVSLFMPVGRGFANLEELLLSADDLREVAESLASASGLTGNSGEDDTMIDLFPRESCGAGKRVISIGPDGEVYPCALLHYPALGFGNIFELPLSRILGRMDGLVPSVDEVPECGECNVRYFCGGGCRAYSFTGFGHFLAKDPYCEFYRHIFGAYVWN